jgi:peroxiredoxin
MTARLLPLLLPAALIACAAEDEKDDHDHEEVEDLPGFEVGATPPDFTLPDDAGAEQTLSAQVGLGVLIFSAAEWCGSCQALLPEVAAWSAGAPDDLIIWNVLLQDTTGQPASVDAAAGWSERFDLPFPVLADTGGAWMAAWGGAGGSSQHSTTLVDRDGHVFFRRADGRATTVSELDVEVSRLAL